MAHVRRLVVGALLFVGAVGCGEDVFSGVQVLRVTPALEVSLDSSQCSSIDTSDDFGGVSSSSGAVLAAPSGTRPDFWFEETVNEDGIAFKFGSGPATRENKLYRNLFFETGKLDRFVVKSQMGDNYVVSVWGSAQCDDCPPGSKATGAGEDKMCGAEEALEVVEAMADD